MADVKCRHCRGIFLETTKLYDPNIPSHGAMFRLKEKYGPKGYNWSIWPYKDYIRVDALECPGCNQPLINKNKIVEVLFMARDGEGNVPRVTITESPKTASIGQVNTTSNAYVCAECGKTKPTLRSLSAHMRYQHPAVLHG